MSTFKTGDKLYSEVISKAAFAFVSLKVVLNDRGEVCNGEILDSNPVFEKLTGKSRKELIGKLITDAFPLLKNTSRVDFFGFCTKVLVSDECLEFEEYSRATSRWLKANIIKNSDTQLTLIITDTTSNRKELERLNLYSQSLITAVPDLIFVIDKQKVFIDFVSGDQSRFTVPKSEFLGKPYKDVVIAP